MSLTDLKIKNAAPRKKEHKLSDGQNLYLVVRPNGSKVWQYRYRFDGKQKTFTLGKYPDLSLSKARQARNDAYSTLLNGNDPVEERRQLKYAAASAREQTFEAVSLDFIENERLKDKPPAEVTLYKHRWCLNSLSRLFRNKSVKAITRADCANEIQIINRTEKAEKAQRVATFIRRVMERAEDLGQIDLNPATRVSKIARSPEVTHHPAIVDERELGKLLRDIDEYQGAIQTRIGLQLLSLTFLRPGELRHGRWSEIDWDKREWVIPSERMKMNREHLVPLSKQALELLSTLCSVTGSSDLMFPAQGKAEGVPMSENTMNQALKRLGYAGRHTSHGFRATATSTLETLGFPEAIVEKQMSHEMTNKVRKAYNRNEYLEARIDMMQKWADHLDITRSKT